MGVAQWMRVLDTVSGLAQLTERSVVPRHVTGTGAAGRRAARGA